MCDNSNVVLKDIEITDAKVLMQLNNNTSVSKTVVGNPKVVNFEQQLEWMKGIPLEKNTRRWMVYYIGKAVGTVIVSDIDWINYVGTLNIKILPEYQGKGIAFNALNLACQIAFDDLNLECLNAHILPFNHKSIDLFEKLGFVKEGVLRSRILKNEERFDLISYSLLRSEFEN